MVGFSQTMFINIQIDKGIYLWTILLDFSSENTYAFRIGVSPASLLSKFRNAVLGDVDGSCSLCFFKNHDHKLYTSLWGVTDASDFPKARLEVPEKFVVSIEINTSKQILSFFVNDKKLSRAISKIHKPSYVGISGYGKQSFVSLSFYRLPYSVPSPIKCKLFQCKLICDL